MEAISDWKLKDWLEAAAYTVAILGAIAGTVIFLLNSRSNAIEANRTVLTRAWTNEGDMLATDTKFVDLLLENHDGDITGTLRSPQLDQPLDVSVDVGWFYSTLSITQLHGRTIAPIATVKLKIAGNDNRLLWQSETLQLPDYLPKSTSLWPHPTVHQ